MKSFVQFTMGLLLVLSHQGITMASDQILLNDPCPTSEKSVAESAWVRLGGHDKAGLSREGETMVWNTSAQNMILNQFALGEVAPLSSGESVIFKTKFRASGIQAEPRGFQIGLFNSQQKDIPGDSPTTVVNAKFSQYGGYIVAIDLGSQQGQGIIIYRRNVDSGASDQNNLFSLSTANVTFLKSGQGYSPTDNEDVEFTLQIENVGTGVRISVSMNGSEVAATDTVHTESFDTVALLSYGGNTRAITFTQCEVRLVQ